MKIALISAGTALVMAGTAWADVGGWNASVGAGVVLAPVFAGSGEGKVRGLPLIDISRPDSPFFLNTYKGLGAKFSPAPGWEAGMALQYVPGRDEGDDSHLRGLGDIDDTAGIDAFASYALNEQVKLEGDIRQELGGSEGWTGRFGVSGVQPINATTRLIGGVNTTFGSDRYMQDWYGVNVTQASRSGLPAYNAEAGFRDIGAKVGVIHALNEKVSLNATAGYAVLVGDAKDSPVSEKNYVPSLMLGATYRF
jgi:outer membrane scaffolding protein for murein synthesis (MipA/OmpV family)